MAAVILFAGLGAVLNAYSTAVVALDSAADVMTSTELLREKAMLLDLQMRQAGGGVPGDSGHSVKQGMDYEWTITVSQQSGLYGMVLRKAAINVNRLKGGAPRMLACEWTVFPNPATQGSVH